MYSLKLTYDGDQHATAVNEPNHSVLAIDCPYTGKGEEFSPASLLSTSLASCMLLSMGAVAQHHDLDLTGTVVDIRFTGMNKTFPHVDRIDLVFDIPRDCSEAEQKILKKAAGLCPIMASIDAETKITTVFNFGVAQAA